MDHLAESVLEAASASGDEDELEFIEAALSSGCGVAGAEPEPPDQVGFTSARLAGDECFNLTASG